MPRICCIVGAGLSTPAETASRDWVAGTLWLEQMIREYQQQQQQQPVSKTPTATSRLIWIQTTPSSLLPLTLMLNGCDGLIVSDNQNNVTIINASLDPWGWDHDNDTDTANSLSVDDAAASPPHNHRRPLANIDSLQSILAAVQFEMNNNYNNNNHIHSFESIMVAFDSLTLLWTRHVFVRVSTISSKPLSYISSSSSFES